MGRLFLTVISNSLSTKKNCHGDKQYRSGCKSKYKNTRNGRGKAEGSYIHILTRNLLQILLLEMENKKFVLFYIEKPIDNLLRFYLF